MWAYMAQICFLFPLRLGEMRCFALLFGPYIFRFFILYLTRVHCNRGGLCCAFAQVFQICYKGSVHAQVFRIRSFTQYEPHLLNSFHRPYDTDLSINSVFSQNVYKYQADKYHALMFLRVDDSLFLSP